jgi:hypothetical protein
MTTTVSHGSDRRLHLLLGVAALVVVLSLARIAVFWPNEAYLDTVSGVWTALAADLSDGVFYRPLFGPDGYGGTRYFPLHFVLHATVLRLTDDPVLSGQIIAALSVSLLVLGTYLLIRALGGTSLLAAASAPLLLASQTTQEALLSIKGDGLAAALSVLGVAVCARAATPKRMVAGGALFVLALATKPTAVHGAVATVLWLVASRRAKPAIWLLATTAIGGLALLAVMHLGSDGRAFESLWAGASTGLRLSDLLRAPLTFARLAREVPETLVFIQLGIAAALVSGWRPPSGPGLGTLFFAATLAVSVVIVAFEGTDTNHLIDINQAAIVAVAAFVATRTSREAAIGVSALGVAALAASLSLGSGLINRRAEQRRGTLAEALALVENRTRPILAENPLVALAAGQRPYMLDSYMFRMIAASDSAFGQPFRQALQAQAFGAVILERNPHDERGTDWYRSAFFGDGFIEELERHYEKAGSVRMRIVYRPRPR